MVTTNAPIITLRDVRFTYDGGATWALDGVSLDIRRGERICLTGPNGSGKSTLSRVIAGLVAPDEGYVVLSGNVVFDESGAHADEYRTARCGIGAVFQHPEDQIVTTVTEDDVAFGPENLAIEHDEIGLRISGSLDAVDMSDYRASDPTRMSGGQQQRIAIAGMLAMDSDVLVLDEPTSYLDIRYQIDLLRILRHLAKSRNVAVIMSIHELELAQKSADKVICVKDGRVFRAGAPEDIFTRETIGELYGLQHGTFNERFGSVEIGRPHGDAHTFVIAGAGTGSAVFRQLIRQGKAFYAGVLHEGDIDCELARDLATECVAERAFEPIGDKTIARAKELLVHCTRLIVCPAAFGTINARNAELVEFARSHGIEVMQACEGASEDSHLEWEG